MEGKGHWMDNGFIERFWRIVKYEEIYLKAYASMVEVKKGLVACFPFYDEKRRSTRTLTGKPRLWFTTTL